MVKFSQMFEVFPAMEFHSCTRAMQLTRQGHIGNEFRMDQAQLDSLEKKIGSLESEVFKLRAELERAKRHEGSKAAVPFVPATTVAPGTKTVSAHAPAPRPASAEADAAHNDSFSWEWLIGGNIIGKIGIVTLIVSTALFMVYALDQGWLSEWIRLLMLQAAFGALSFMSYRLYKKDYKYIPEILAITALAANTIAIYSAHFIYHFLGRGETMGMMFLLMALSLAFARRIRSTALAVILFAGFFALPVIHSRGINEPGAYFTYLLAVNVLYFILQRFRQSPHTLWMIVIGNGLSVLGWVGTYNQYALSALAFCGLTLASLLVTAHSANWAEKGRQFFHPASILSVNVFYALMISSVLSANKDFMREAFALALLGQAALNFVVLQFMHSRRYHLSAAALIIVLLMATGIATLIDGPAERLTVAVLLTGALVASGRAHDGLLYFGIGIANGMNLLALLTTQSHSTDVWFLLNFQAAGFLFYSVAAVYLRVKSLWPPRFNFGPVLTAVALLSSFVGVITELQRLIIGKDARLLMVTLVFAAYALVLLFIGFKYRKVWFRQAGLFFMGLAIAKFYLVDIWQWDKSIRILAGIIMGGGLVLVSFYYEKFRGKFKELGLVLLIGGAILSGDGIEAAEKFKPNRFKFVKELQLKPDSTGESRYGRALLDAELYRSAGENDLRLAYDGKLIPYARQTLKTGEDRKVEKEIPVASLITSVDGENNSVYVFENKEHVRANTLKLAFKEADYNREIQIYQRAGRFDGKNVIKTVTISKKAGKPEQHTIAFDLVSGEIQVHVRNDDDEALNLTQFIAVSEKEYVAFRVPEKFDSEKKPLQLYYGAEYAQRPRYDITDAISEGNSYQEFSLAEGKSNPNFKLTLFDPPYSIWFFRTVFWLLLAMIAWQMYAVYRKEKSA